MQTAGLRKLRDEYPEPDEAPRRNLHLVGDVAPEYAENGRRTVRITGQTAPPPRRRRSPAATQIQARPDRVALWAVLLGLFLVFMAVATANAATF